MKLITRFFSPSSKNYATMLLAVATFLSYLAGFFRDLIIAYTFGATGATDAYFAAFLIPDVIFAFSAGGFLSGIFLKVYSKEKSLSKESAEKLSGSFLFWMLSFVILICGLAYIFMPQLVAFVFNESSSLMQNDIIEFSRILLFSPLIFSISNFFGSILMNSKHYLSYALSPFFYNLGIIGMTLFLGPVIGIKAAILGVVLGLCFHFLFRFWDFNHAKIKLSFSFYHTKLFEIIKLSLPKIFGLLSMQLTLLFFAKMALSYQEGINTAFNLARNIQSFAVSLFAISFATAVYPFILDLVHDKKESQLKVEIEDSMLRILTFCLAATSGMYVLLRPMISGLFEYGSFGSVAAENTILILVFLLIAIPFEGLNHLYSRIYYAFSNTILPVIFSQFFLFTSTFGVYYFAERFGVYAFGFFFALGVIIQNILLLSFLKKYVEIPFVSILKKLSKLIFACFIMVLAVYPINLFEINPLVKLLLGSLLGALVYFVCLHYLKMIQYTGINFKKIYVRIFG
ncbi:hypothetical protein CL656_04655 [bacterium]|nr:hypothetical protein [bacterium]